MIVGAGWRVFITILALNSMHMQAVVQVTQIVTKTAIFATEAVCHITVGWDAVAKATANY